MNKYSVIGCLYIASLLLGGCATLNYHEVSSLPSQANAKTPILPPPIYSDGFSEVEINANDIFTLTNLQSEEFKKYLASTKNANDAQYMRVAKYIQDFSDGFDYKTDTYTASQAFEKQQGNCLSLAIMSSALAELANVKYKYRKVHSAPVYHELNNTQLISSHVNVTLFDEFSSQSQMRSIMVQKMVLSPASVTIDYFRNASSISTEVVSKDELIIMYWHNLAGDALLEGNLDLAFTYVKKANSLDPMHPETLNLLSVLYNRIGEKKRAIEVYEYAMANELYSLTIIDNYASLLHQSGKSTQANELWAVIQDVTDDNPYTWLHLGKDHLKENNLTQAETLFLRSANLGPYLHEPHFYLAQVYEKQNKMASAKQALSKAKEMAYIPVDQKRYQAKLNSFE